MVNNRVVARTRAVRCASANSTYIQAVRYGLIAMKEKTERFEVHLGASILKALDEWRRRQSNLPSRGVAIRLLVERGLAGNTTAPRQLRKGGRRKAAEMAGREIDRLGDQAATGEQRASRKRRLIRGPKEFRDMRRK
jgi:hypothetical protein